MKRFSALLLGIIALLGTTELAQNTSTQKPSGPFVNTRLTSLEADMARYIFAADEPDDARRDPVTRSRVVKTDSGVGANVVSNLALLERAAFDLINQRRAEN